MSLCSVSIVLPNVVFVCADLNAPVPSGHYIFYPFEYPKEWVIEGCVWDEGYFLKAFLMYNNKFEIKLFSEYIHKH